MKMRHFFSLAVLTISFSAQSVFAAEKIDSYQVTVELNKNSSIEITEEIEYNFGSSQRHGIYRDIPYKYKARGGNFSLDISEIEVTDKVGNKYDYKVSKSGGELNLKIGDPDLYVSGKKYYKIKYEVDRAINYFEDFDELYWNAIGTNWDVVIENPSIKFVLPESFDNDDLRISCYTGIEGSGNQCKYFVSESGKEVSFIVDSLNPNEGITFAVGFPKGVAYEPTVQEKILSIILDNIILALPLIVFFVMFFLWWTRGRDPRGSGTIVTQFEPPNNLTPLEIGIIKDEKSDSSDISAQIIHLATKGYLRIEKIDDKVLFFSKKDYRLVKIKGGDEKLADFDRRLIDGLFGSGHDVKLSDLKKSFYKDAKKINKKAYKKLVSDGYFKKNPNLVRAAYTFIGGVIIFMGFFLGSSLFSEIVGGSIFISGIIIVIFGNIMPVKTKKGVLAKEHILGLKDYLKVAEKDRLEFHNAPEKTPEHFEKLLPFAMALGVEKQWAKQFEGIYNKNPDWYNGPIGSTFTPTAFASDMKSFAMATAASGGSGSSGGGGVGGGGGGGGGGSW